MPDLDHERCDASYVDALRPVLDDDDIDGEIWHQRMMLKVNRNSQEAAKAPLHSQNLWHYLPHSAGPSGKHRDELEQSLEHMI